MGAADEKARARGARGRAQRLGCRAQHARARVQSFVNAPAAVVVSCGVPPAGPAAGHAAGLVVLEPVGAAVVLRREVVAGRGHLERLPRVEGATACRTRGGGTRASAGCAAVGGTPAPRAACEVRHALRRCLRVRSVSTLRVLPLPLLQPRRSSRERQPVRGRRPARARARAQAASMAAPCVRGAPAERSGRPQKSASSRRAPTGRSARARSPEVERGP